MNQQANILRSFEDTGKRMQDLLTSRVNFVNNPLDSNAKNEALRAYAEIMYYNTNGKTDYRNDFSKIPPVVLANLPSMMEKSLYAAQNKSYKYFSEFAKIALGAESVEPLKYLLEIAQKQNPLLQRAQVAALSDAIGSELTQQDTRTDFQKPENLVAHNNLQEYVQNILNDCEQKNLNVKQAGLASRVEEVMSAVAALNAPGKRLNMKIIEVLTSGRCSDAIGTIQETGTPPQLQALQSAQEKADSIVSALRLANGLSNGG
jgi:hypothetical protein